MQTVNVMELNFMPGARGLLAFAFRAPGAYKVGPGRAACGVACRPGPFGK